MRLASEVDITASRSSSVLPLTLLKLSFFEMPLWPEAIDVDCPQAEVHIFRLCRQTVKTLQSALWTGCCYHTIIKTIPYVLGTWLHPSHVSIARGIAELCLLGRALATTLEQLSEETPESSVGTSKRLLRCDVESTFFMAMFGVALLASRLAYILLSEQHVLAPFIVAAVIPVYKLAFHLLSYELLELNAGDYVIREYLVRKRKALTSRRRALSQSVLDDPDPMPLYQYRSIDARIQTRLLKLEADSQDRDRMHCVLSEYHADDMPSYSAISYCWGASELVGKLLIGRNQKTYLPITKSARDVLRSVCPVTGKIYIWIDAVCINQADDREKNCQVPLMRKIYSNATQVIAHLGQSSTESGMDTLLARLYKVISDDGRDELAPAVKKLLSKLRLKPRQYSHESWSRDEWTMLQPLLSNDYWTRCWIVQECALAKSLVFIYNDKPIAHDILLNLCLHLILSGGPSGQRIRERAVHVTATLTIGKRNEQKLSLMDLMLRFSHLKASNPRDKIYAFLGMSQDKCVVNIVPDYSARVEDVYKAFAEVMLEFNMSGFFNLLGSGSHSSNAELLDLPSWVPNFQATNYLGAGNTTNSYHKERAYAAGGRSSVVYEIDRSTNQLKIKGVLLDRVVRVTRWSYFNGEMRSFSNWSCLCDDSLPDLRHATIGSSSGVICEKVLDATAIFETEAKVINTCYGESEAIIAFWAAMTYDFASSALKKISDDVGVVPRLQAFVSSVRKARRTCDDRSLHQEHPKDFIMLCPIGVSDFVVTENGLLALAPPRTQPGDVVAIFKGLPMPYVLRPSKTSGETYMLRGEAYVHSVMHGEAIHDGITEWIVLH